MIMGTIVAAAMIAASVATWAWMRDAASSVDPPPISYVAASPGVNPPNLAELVDRFAVAPASGLIVFVDRSRAACSCDRQARSRPDRSLERQTMRSCR